MLMMHVTLLFRHKSSFSYLPPLLTCSAIISTHTLFLLISCSSTCCKTQREASNLCVVREQLLLCLFQARCYGKHFLAFWVQKCFSPSCHSESFLGSGCLRAPQMQHCSWLTTFLSLLKIPVFTSLHSLRGFRASVA